MKDFRLYDITDFVMDEDFIRWVHNEGHADKIFWSSWLDQNPSKHLIVAEARQIVESMRIAEKGIGAGEIKLEIEKVLRTIRDQGRQTQAPVRPLILPGKWWRVAAAVLLPAGACFLYFSLQKDKKPEKFAYATLVSSPSFIEKVNPSAGMVPLALPDGSTIELAANSRISYAYNFGKSDTRDIYLSGEAFFKIAKNPAHPFRVFANEIITKVLGTSFTIRSFEKDTTISVTVRTGKVSVYSQAANGDKPAALSDKPAGIIVTPNQQLVYQRGDQKFQKILVEHPLFIVPETLDHSMNYEDRPVEQVFDQLGKYYGVNIVYDNELLSKCTVTADLANEPFYHKLDLICKAIGARYEIVDGQVVIQSSGCQ